jgi:AraC-like DNA-binding protein
LQRLAELWLFQILEKPTLGFPVCTSMRAPRLRPDELRVVIGQTGFCVQALAVNVGLDVRTLERRFGQQFHTTPKTWIMRERMSFAPPLLADGLSNKQVAASLSYTCESNFCRDFKRHFGCAPQEFARTPARSFPLVSHFDKELSRSDKTTYLLGQR